jgi:hypothetical protein
VRKTFTVIAFALAVYLAGASPALGATANQKFLTFLAKSASAISAINDDLTMFNDSLGYDDYGGAVQYARNMASHAKTFDAWLDKNKPVACYKNAWTWTHRYAVYTNTGEAAAARWLSAWPWGTDTDFNTFDRNITAAIKALNKSVYYVERSNC